MKNYLRCVILFICLIFAQAVQALTFNVVVIPADLFNVCENYYCFPEVSEIVSNDLIEYFNRSDKIKSPSLYELRANLSQNPDTKTALKSSLDKFNSRGNVDFQTYRQVAKLFAANSVLLISNNVGTENSIKKRSVWELLELSSNFNVSYPFTMETDAVLLDTVNDLVMWSGGYSKPLNSSDGTFSAQKASESYAKYAYMQAYSRDILAKTISQNVVLRFFPKTVDPVVNKQDIKPSANFFRYESTTPMLNRKEEPEEPFEHEYGEMIYGF